MNGQSSKGVIAGVLIGIGLLFLIGKVIQEAARRHDEENARQASTKGWADAWREAGRKVDAERAEKREAERQFNIEFGKKYYAEHPLPPGMTFDTNTGAVKVDKYKLEVGATFKEHGDTYAVRSNEIRGRWYERIDPETGRPPGEVSPWTQSIIDRNKAYREIQKADKTLGLTNGLDRTLVP